MWRSCSCVREGCGRRCSRRHVCAVSPVPTSDTTFHRPLTLSSVHFLPCWPVLTPHPCVISFSFASLRCTFRTGGSLLTFTMTSVFQRSKSNRSLTIDDSFHREQQQQRWAMGKRNSSRRLVRSNSVSSDYARAAGTMPPSSSSAALSKQRGKGKQMLRSVVGFLSRTKSGKGKNAKGSFTMTEPASPASASSSSLSRTNSDSSAHGAGRESDSGQIAAGGPGSTSRPRVSFDAVVQVRFRLVAVTLLREFFLRVVFDIFAGWCLDCYGPLVRSCCATNGGDALDRCAVSNARPLLLTIFSEAFVVRACVKNTALPEYSPGRERRGFVALSGRVSPILYLPSSSSCLSNTPQPYTNIVYCSRLSCTHFDDDGYTLR